MQRAWVGFLSCDPLSHDGMDGLAGNADFLSDLAQGLAFGNPGFDLGIPFRGVPLGLLLGFGFGLATALAGMVAADFPQDSPDGCGANAKETRDLG